MAVLERDIAGVKAVADILGQADGWPLELESPAASCSRAASVGLLISVNGGQVVSPAPALILSADEAAQTRDLVSADQGLPPAPRRCTTPCP